jgi:hypothetical protein
VNTKYPQTGNLQSLTETLLNDFLESQEISAGSIEISASEMYDSFLGYIRTEGYLIEPTLPAVGRILSGRLPFRRSSSGTIYLVSRKPAHEESSK